MDSMERRFAMIRSRLTEFLNKYTFIQAIFCFLPIIFISVYMFAYMTDVMNSYKIITTNNQIVKENMNADYLKEVSYFEENDDNTYSATIEGSSSAEVEVELGDVIYTVSVQDTDWYKLVLFDGSILYQTSCDFIDDIKKDGDDFKATVGDKSFNISRGSSLVDVMLDEDGSYKLSYITDEVEDKTLDSLNTLEVLLKTDNKYKIKVTASYTNTVDNLELNFCSNLPTDNMYYDESTQQYIKNISSDFAKNLIISSNIVVVMVSMLAYTVLLGILRQRKELVLLKNNGVVIVNIFALLILPFCMILTMVLF